MIKEKCWQFLVDLLINLSRQANDDKKDLCKKAVYKNNYWGVTFPLYLWTYHQSFNIIWKVSIIEVFDVVFKNKTDSRNYVLQKGLKIIIEEFTQENEFTKWHENIWSFDEMFPLDDTEEFGLNKRQGWIYEEFEGLIEILEIILLNNLYINEDLSKELNDMRRKHHADQEAENSQLLEEIENLRKRSGLSNS